MAKRFDSKFLVIEGKGSEFLSAGMGGGGGVSDCGVIDSGPLKGFHHIEVLGGGFLLCDHCNEEINGDETCYYVAVLNLLFCAECFNHWHAGARYFESDRPVEERNYRFYADKMGL